MYSSRRRRSYRTEDALGKLYFDDMTLSTGHVITLRKKMQGSTLPGTQNTSEPHSISEVRTLNIF